MLFRDITSNVMQDSGVVNTLKIRTQTPSLKAENMVAAEKTEEVRKRALPETKIWTK